MLECSTFYDDRLFVYLKLILLFIFLDTALLSEAKHYKIKASSSLFNFREKRHLLLLEEFLYFGV